MALRIADGIWECGICHKRHPDASKADACRDSHDIVYLPISRTNLNRLLQFLYTKNDDLLSRDLVETLTRFLRGNE